MDKSNFEIEYGYHEFRISHIASYYLPTLTAVVFLEYINNVEDELISTHLITALFHIKYKK